MTDNSWRDTGKDLFEQGKGIRETSRLCGKAYSTVRNYLVSQRLQSPVELGTSNIVKVETDKTAEGPTIIMIPDTQCKPGLDLSYLEWIGKYIVAFKKLSTEQQKAVLTNEVMCETIIPNAKGRAEQ